MAWQDFIPKDISGLYEVHDYHHAAAVLANEFPAEFTELIQALRQFRITVADITTSGGNESNDPQDRLRYFAPAWLERRKNAGGNGR